MKMIKTQLWLAALIALAVFSVVAFEWSAQRSPDSADQAVDAPQTPWLGDWPHAGGITGIRLRHPASESKPWQLEQINRRWMETAPSRFPVDSPAIDALLESLLASDVVMTPEQLREAGRLPTSQAWNQAASLVLVTEDQQQVETRWLPAGVGGWAYCLNVARDEVWLLERQLLTLMQKPNPAAWRIRRVGQLGQPGSAALDGLQFSRSADPASGRPDIDLDLRRRLDGWRIGESEDAVDREELEQLITRLHAVPLMAFIHDSMDEQTRSTIGLRQESGRITWRWTELVAPADSAGEINTHTTQPTPATQPTPTPGPSTPAATHHDQPGPTQRTLTLRFGPTLDTPGGAWMVAAASFGQEWSPAFLLPADPIEQLFQVAESARDARIIAERWTQITAITIEEQGRPAIAWSRTDQGWQTRFPQQWSAPEIGPFMRLMRTLGEGRAQAFIPRPDREPQRTISLGFPGRSRPLQLHLIAIEDPEHPHVGRWLIYRQGETFGRLLAPADQEILTAAPITFRSLSIDLLPNTWQTLRLEQPRTFTEPDSTPDPASDPIHSDRQAANAYHLFDLKPPSDASSDTRTTPGQQGDLDQQAVASLLQNLQPLGVERWLLHPPSQTAANPVRLIWTDRAGKAHTLTVDPATGQATLTDVDTSFEISPALLRALTAEFRNRIAMPLSQAEIRSVRLYEQDQFVAEIRIARRSIQIESGRQLPQALIRRLLDTAAPLEVLRWVTPENLRDHEPHPTTEANASSVPQDLRPVRTIRFESLAGQQHVIEILGRPNWIRADGRLAVVRPDHDRRLRESWTE